MQSELKPCAHCGGEAELRGFQAPEFWVACPKVGCKAHTEGFGSKERAIAAWNTRASDAEIAAMTVQAEPVAWLYENNGRRHVSPSKVISPRDHFYAWTETPLYAHPPAQWQGIESAPRDGKDLIVAYTHIATVCVFNAFYANPSDGWDADDEGWWTHTYSEVSRVKLDGWQTPTHWMPLPTPPAGGSDE